MSVIIDRAIGNRTTFFINFLKSTPVLLPSLSMRSRKIPALAPETLQFLITQLKEAYLESSCQIAFSVWGSNKWILCGTGVSQMRSPRSTRSSGGILAISERVESSTG